jgi:hypothetical protein
MIDSSIQVECGWRKIARDWKGIGGTTIMGVVD